MRRALVVVMLVVAVVAVGCSSEPAETTTTVAAAGSAAETTTTAGAETTTTTVAAAAETTTTAAAAADGGLQECVIGEWILDSEGFFELVVEEFEEEAGDFDFVGGEYALIVNADGTFSSERRDWTFGFMSDLGSLEVRTNHVQAGTWTLEGDVLTTATVASEPPEIEFLIDGVPFEFPGGTGPIAPPEAEFSGARVTCDGDVLTAEFDGFTSEWART